MKTQIIRCKQTRKKEIIIENIYVVDQIMGSGKTSAMINKINSSPDSEKFIYVTPYLTEVKRIKDACSARHFTEPSGGTKKTYDFRKLVAQRRNIVTTHSLLLRIKDRDLVLLEKAGYTLVMDEAINCVHTIYNNKNNVDKYICISSNEDDDEVNDEICGIIRKLDKTMSLASTYKYQDRSYINMYDISVFRAFKNIYILTYLFEAQMIKYYFDFYKMKYAKIGVTKQNGKYGLSDKCNASDTNQLKNLIHICDNKKLNNIGKSKYSLSVSWFKKSTIAERKQIRNNCFNFFHNIMKSKTNNNLWTTFKSYHKELSNKGYATGFAPINQRASNDFKERSCVAYLANRYINPNFVGFFHKYGITVNSDTYALSELVQFIWRSAIRDGKEIWIYIPSKRMRELLIDWIDNPEKYEVIK